MRLTVVVAALAIFSLAAFALGRVSRAPEPTSLARVTPGAENAELPVTPDGADVALLSASLDVERAARERLEAEVARLREELAELAGGTRPAGDTTGAAKQSPGSEKDPGAADRAWFDDEALRQAGMRPADAEALRELWEEVQLDRLYLPNQAEREGWQPRRLNQELRVTNQRLASVRVDYGEPVWDWFLYSTGQKNRVEVEGVLGGSPAAEAGLKAGDTIVSYGGRRVYTPLELRQATQAGSLGETVAVQVSRGGAMEQLTLPRGPLGVRLNAAATRPPRL